MTNDNTQQEKAMADYLALRAEVDDKVKDLLAEHGGEIVCKPGCCDCCVNLSVFPVEYAVISAEQADGAVSFDANASCGFLRDGLCQIYESRPLICRTHGMPIVFLDDEHPDGPAYSVSFCPMNFPDGGYDIEFSAENTINIDEMNDRLYEINQQFVEALGQPDIDGKTRIELSKIVEGE